MRVVSQLEFAVAEGGRFWPLVLVGMRLFLNESADQPQEHLMFRTRRATDQERANFNVADLPTRGGIRDVLNERVPGSRVASEIPPVPVRAGVDLSRLGLHRVPAPWFGPSTP